MYLGSMAELQVLTLMGKSLTELMPVAIPWRLVSNCWPKVNRKETGKKKEKNLGVFWCFKLVIVEEMIPKGGFVFCLVFKRFKLVTVEINPQGRIFVENLGVFVFRVWSSEKEKKTKGDFIW